MMSGPQLHIVKWPNFWLPLYELISLYDVLFVLEVSVNPGLFSEVQWCKFCMNKDEHSTSSYDLPRIWLFSLKHYAVASLEVRCRMSRLKVCMWGQKKKGKTGTT